MVMAIVRRYEGGDLVVTQAELATLGLVPGQCISIRAMNSISLYQTPGVEEMKKRQTDLNTAWGRTSLDEAVEAESTYEDPWQRWSGNR